MAVVGGAWLGPRFIPGAAFVVLVPELLRGFGEYYPMVYGLAMILIFVFWPRGLIGFVRLIGRRISGMMPAPGASTRSKVRGSWGKVMQIYPIWERVLGRFAADKAAQHGERPFIFYGERTISYRELDEV